MTGPLRKHLGFIVFSLAILLLLLFPVYALVNRVEPILFGLPLGLAWIVAVIAVEFVGVLVFYLRDEKRGENDD